MNEIICEGENSCKIILISFILNIISKFNENSFLIIVIKGKIISNIILYFSSILSSFILNLFFIIVGLFLHHLLKTDIINNFFLIIVFALYGFMSLISIGRICSNKNDEHNKIIDNLINSSSDEESEKPKILIDSDKVEEEIELDNIKLDEIDDERKNNNFKKFRKNNNNMIINEFNLKHILECFKTIISTEIGEKIQIFNIALSSKFKKLNYLIIGNIFGIIIINAIAVCFGLTILQNRINNYFIFIETLLYLGFIFYYIYISYF